MSLVDYQVVKTIPPSFNSSLFTYLFAGNGVFVQAQRPGISVIIPVNLYPYSIRGLPQLQPHCQLDFDLIPKEILLSIWRQSCLAVDSQGFLEILFHLHKEVGQDWVLETPTQTQTSWQCQTQEVYLPPAIAEFHSHGQANAYFSATDDLEENGLRLYGVMGRLDGLQPEILLRIGVYQHFMTIPASLVCDLPNFFIDVALRDGISYDFYTV